MKKIFVTEKQRNRRIEKYHFKLQFKNYHFKKLFYNQ